MDHTVSHREQTRRLGLHPLWQALPMGTVFILFFLFPLLLILLVSFWDFNEYELLPGFTWRNYLTMFEGCTGLNERGDFCLTLATYLSTFKFTLITWAVTLVLGFAIAYFLAFHVQGVAMQTFLFALCTVPFWTSNVIRMISWIPLLGRHGWVNQSLQTMGLVTQPLEWLLFSDFSVLLAFVHLYTMFMIVPIFNSMMRIDMALIEAAQDMGASTWQILWQVIMPLSRTGMVIGSIFILTIVVGDFVTVGVMGGQQIASVGKMIQVQTSYLQFPLAAANAVVLLVLVLLMVGSLMRLVDVRKEL